MGLGRGEDITTSCAGTELPVGGAEKLVMLQGERVSQGQQSGALTPATLECAHLYRPCHWCDLVWTQSIEEELMEAATRRVGRET